MVVTNQQIAIASAMKDPTYSTSSQLVGYGKTNVHLASKKYQVNPRNVNSNLTQSKEELVLRKTYGNKWAELDLDKRYENLYQ